MNEHNDDIEKLLSEYKVQKNRKENHDQIEPLEPPKRREELIDFSKPEEKSKKKEKPKKSPEEIAALKQKRRQKADKILKNVFSKKVLLSILALALMTALGFGIKYGIDYSKTSYLKPYIEKYPDVEFPAGILEKYCDAYGENPSITGYIKINDIGIDKMLSAEDIEGVTQGASIYNYVVYLNDSNLEECYKNADAYNSSGKEISYTDLLTDYTFQVVGAYYTNTDEKDDDGYIFPYNTTEKMTFESTNSFIERQSTRFLYKVSTLDLARQDTLLTISCPTEYKQGYRFVVVCKAVDEINHDATATEKNDPHITDSEYKEKGVDNPYRFASKWYPEIIITDSDGNETTIQKTIDDYK